MSRAIGDIAEDRAAEYLQERGYRLLERNYFARVGEIDIIAEKESVICFIEVKDRSYGSFGGAVAAITSRKLAKIIKTARMYLYEKRASDRDWRVDAVLINGDNEPEILENIYIEGMR